MSMSYINLLPLIVVLGFIASSFARIEGTKDYTSYFRSPLCRASDDVRYPTNTNEIVAIVKEAIRRRVTVKAFGERHSTTDIICTDGIPIDMRNIRSFKMNADNTATFGAGVNLHDAMDFLRQHNRAFRVMPGFGNITLGGACGTGAHGSSIKYHSSLSAQVARLTIVNGLGEIETISRQKDLRSFKTHLGLLGIVVYLTMYTVPLYKVRCNNYIVSDEVLTNGKAIDWARTSDQIIFNWYPSFKKVAVFNQTIVPLKTPGKAKGHTVPQSSTEQSVFQAMYKETAYNLASSQCQQASTLGMEMLHALELLSLKTSVNQMFTSGRNSTEYLSTAVSYPQETFFGICGKDLKAGPICSWLHPEPYSMKLMDIEFGCALTDLPSIVETIKDVVNKTPTVFTLYGIIFRFSAKNKIYMSTAYKRDTVHIEYLLWERADQHNDACGNLAGYQTVLQALTKKFGGRSHWGKSGLVYHSKSMLDLKLDPFARYEFVEAMKKFDPYGLFLNSFGRRLRYRDTKIDLDPLATRCALLDNCFCSKNSDCGDSQKCTRIKGYDYNVCETRNITRTKTFNENKFSNKFNIVNWFNNEIPALISSLKC